MSTEDYRALGRRFIEDTWHGRDLAALDEICDANFVSHDATNSPPGLEGYKQLLTQFHAAFPDLHSTIEDEILEGDKLVMRFTMRGTHQGPLFGIAPTGKAVTMTGISIGRIANGKFVETWTNADLLGLFQQLGVLPAPGQAS